MQQDRINTTNINGWGIDADHENEPTYPMKNYTGVDRKRSNWQRPVLQESDTEILMSTERPMLPAVYGTILPPKGLSGVIRRFAFRYSENKYRHWLPLLIADRVDAIEGIFSDLSHGKFPNVYKEKGWIAIGKHNKPLLMRKIAVRVWY